MVQPVSSATTSIGTLPAPGPATERQGEDARWSAEAQRYAVDLSRNAYLLLVAATIATYLLLWLTHFQYVYGWLNDDRTLYVKGLATLKDWSGAFSFYNALQPYFFLISYLPLKLGVSLPSQPLPFLGEQTGQFRFLLLYTMLLHAVLLGVWAWFAPALTPSRLVAWLSLLLFATSPSLIFWSPQADSRVLGLPFLLAGLWLLVQRGHSQPAARWTTAWAAFAAGSLFGVAQGIHYTSLYLIVPVSVALWGGWLAAGWRQARYWRGLLSFLVGCLWLQALMEYLSDRVLHTPWEEGPTMTLLALRSLHAASFTLLETLRLWGEMGLSQVGIPLLLAVGGGAALWLRRDAATSGLGRVTRYALVISLFGSLAYLIVAGTQVFFRQTSVLQPFLFLFASVAVVWLARQAVRLPGGSVVALVALVVLVGLVPWRQAAATFEAHQGIGRVLEWVAQNRGDRVVRWVRVSWFDDAVSLTSPDMLATLPADAWLISYFPWKFLNEHPGVQPYLAATRPAMAAPSLYATDAMRAELEGRGYNDFRTDPLLRDVRVTPVGALLETARSQPLAVASITADSENNPGNAARNVFDHDRSADGPRAWVSAGSPLPHSLEVQLAQPAAVGEVWVALSAGERSASRIGALDVWAADDVGTYTRVWSGSSLERYPTIAARWEPRRIQGLKLVVSEAHEPQRPTSQVAIEEIVLPGYDVQVR